QATVGGAPGTTGRPRAVVRSGRAASRVPKRPGGHRRQRRGHRHQRHRLRSTRACRRDAGAAGGVAGLGLAVFALLDGWYLVRFPCAVLRARLLQPRVRDLLAEQRFRAACCPRTWTCCCMNNARYLREADLRTAHLTRCGVSGAEGCGRTQCWRPHVRATAARCACWSPSRCAPACWAGTTARSTGALCQPAGRLRVRAAALPAAPAGHFTRACRAAPVPAQGGAP
uniref:Uncharacterized protein n=1 Tax=Macaca fascicularis TaxID=9541 RepID=A0A7N9IGM9_MACFA